MSPPDSPSKIDPKTKIKVNPATGEIYDDPDLYLSDTDDEETRALVDSVISTFNDANSAAEIANTLLGSSINSPSLEDATEVIRKGDALPPRRCKNWLHEYLKLSIDQESPEIFHLWSGISAIAAATRRNTFIDFGFYRLYPNLYIILVATSAQCKKSTAALMAAAMFDNIPIVNIAKDKMTPEGLLNRMANTLAKPESPLDTRVKKDGSVYIVAEELKVLFSNAAYMSSLIEVFTALYGCPNRFPFTTKHAPIEVHNTCVNLLGASTPEWLAMGMPDFNTSGGFLGRIIFVVAHEPKKKVPWPTMDLKLRQLRVDLIEDLKTITKCRGQFTVTEEAKEIFNSWYNSYTVPDEHKLVEYYARKHDTIRKVAMVLSLSTSSDLVIKPIHMTTAMKLLDSAEAEMVDAFAFLGSTANALINKQILSLLYKAGRLTRAQLTKAISYRLRSIRDLDDALIVLQNEERIVRELSKDKSDKDEYGSPNIYYRLTSKQEKERSVAIKKRRDKLTDALFQTNGDYM